MTTYTAFTPAANQSPPFQFLPMLDKQQYSVTTTWNMFGQRWYINVYSLSGGLVVSTPLIASPQGTDFNLVAGYFTTSTLVYRDSTSQFEVTP